MKHQLVSLFAFIAFLTYSHPAAAQLIQLDAATIKALQSSCEAPVSIAGTWDFTLLKNNVPLSSGTIQITQTKSKIKGVTDQWTLVGSVRANTLFFTMVVTGEELEGFVRKVDATVDGARMTGVFVESDGDVGSFVALKQ